MSTTRTRPAKTKPSVTWPDAGRAAIYVEGGVSVKAENLSVSELKGKLQNIWRKHEKLCRESRGEYLYWLRKKMRALGARNDKKDKPEGFGAWCEESLHITRRTADKWADDRQLGSNFAQVRQPGAIDMIEMTSARRPDHREWQVRMPDALCLLLRSQSRSGWVVRARLPSRSFKQSQAAVKADAKKAAANDKSEAAPASPMTPEERGKARSEGFRLYKLAGRPSKKDFIAVFGKQGVAWTWEARAEAVGLTSTEEVASKFQSLLKKAARWMSAIRFAPCSVVATPGALEALRASGDDPLVLLQQSKAMLVAGFATQITL